MDKILKEIKLDLAIVVSLVSGFLTGMLVLGLVPADGVDFNVLGSLVLAVPLGAVYYLTNRYVKARVPSGK